MKILVLLGGLCVLFRAAYGGYCTESYSCTKTCSSTRKGSTSCYIFFRCSKYWTVYRQCDSTCTRRVCCEGWTGSTCSTPVCYGSTNCPNDGTCNAPNSCDCKTGFALPQCTDINECSSGNGGCAQSCTNTHGSFRCSCKNGYILNSDEKTCLDINECFTNNGGCQQKCENLPGSSRCACNEGYSLYSDDKTCRDINECTADSSNCQHNCHNTVGSYTCSCNKGYNLALDKWSCKDEDECARSDPVCGQQCHNTIGSFMCSCNTGYTLQADQSTCTDDNECDIINGNCQHICANEPGRYSCSCKTGFLLHGNKHNCTDIDECSDELSGCSHTCTNTKGSFTCSCLTGYELDKNGKTCTDIDDCAGIECLNGGSCVDGLMSYKCSCRNGYTGSFCQSDVDECQLLNGGCQDICTNHVGSFECSCFDNRTLNSNGISCKGLSNAYNVFQKHNITGKALPRGCWVIQIAKCSDGKNFSITLSSTSTWLSSKEHQGLRFTYGIVFAEVNTLSIPISLDGVEIKKTPDSFNIRLGVRAEFTNIGSTVGTQRLENCISFNFSRSDKFEFIAEGSFIKSVFVSVLAALPNWLQFESTNTSALRVNNMKTDLVYGRDIDSVPSCRGAPIFPGNMYSVFTFGTDFVMKIYGNSISIPRILSGEQFCLIVDICQTHGATAFLMLPKQARSILSKVSSFKTLFTDQGNYIEPHGIGLSLSDGINVHNHTQGKKIWNGYQIINYPATRQANFWIGGDFVHNKSSSLFGSSGQADIFLTVPSIHRIITAVFLDEWNGFVSVRASTATVNLELFGQRFQLPFHDIISTTLDIYMSVGGTGQRSMCGETANPPGIFFSAMLKINPFPNVPILKDWLFDNTHKAYLFFMSDSRNTLGDALAVNIFEDIIGLEDSLTRLNNFVRKLLEDIKDFIVSNTKLLLQNITTAARNVIDIVQRYVNEIRHGNFNISQLVNMLNEIWRNITSLQKDVELFIDSAELFVDVLTDNATVFIQSELNTIKEKFNEAVDHLNQQVNSMVQDYDGFGLKYRTTVILFGLKINGLDVEYVYSRSRLFHCSRFDKVYELMKDKQAARILARVSTRIRLGHFFKLDAGIGIGMALAKKSFDFVAQVQVSAGILGVRATADLFITNKHVSLYTELNVWNIFLAHVDILAEHERDWYDLILKVRGIFAAKARNKRQNQTGNKSFQSSYLDALKRVAIVISNEADKRISQAQLALSVAQNGLTKAQDWLEEKKKDLRKANTAFDNAVDYLEDKKHELEEAKAPYNRAIRKLEEAQKDVDKLCKIRTCGTFCIPGIKCKICRKRVWGVKIPYPCCRFTKCVIRLPNPLCVAANVLCAIVRGIAYLALEAAKIIVRAVILVYDAAKLAVTVAQIIVDKSRVVLTLAEGVLTLAEAGLEGAKGVLEVANVALEAIKVTIGTAVKVLEFVIEYGIKQILDVRNCGFDIELSTTDLPVFDVSCEVNAFKLGWKTFRIRINFKNIFQSIWQAAKATIKAIMDGFTAIFSGRKRRELSFVATSKIHKFLRQVRSQDEVVNSTESAAIDFIDTLSYNDGFANDELSDYNNRVDLFRLKCRTITKILAFFNETFLILFDIANETNHGIEESQLAKSQLQQYSSSDIANNLTLEEAGINIQNAYDDYNITEADLDQALKEGKAATVNDSLLGEIDSSVQLSSDHIDSEMSAAESVQILNQWLFAMENTTNSYFNESECVRFRDCIYHSIALLYDLYTEEQMPEMDTVLGAISSLEDYLLDVLQNASSSISETFNASSVIMSNIHLLSDLNLFCSQPPVFTASAGNHTVEIGSNASIPCHVSADPAPTFWWYKDGNLMIEQTTNILWIHNVSHDDMAVYICVAGNIVANITSDEMHLRTITHIEPPDGPEDRKDFAVILVPTLFCVLAVSAVIIIVRWYRNRKTNTQSGRSVRRGGVNTSGDCNMYMDTLRPQREPSNEYTDLDTVGTPAVEPSTRESSRPDFYADNAGYGYVIDT